MNKILFSTQILHAISSFLLLTIVSISHSLRLMDIFYPLINIWTFGLFLLQAVLILSIPALISIYRHAGQHKTKSYYIVLCLNIIGFMTIGYSIVVEILK